MITDIARPWLTEDKPRIKHDPIFGNVAKELKGLFGDYGTVRTKGTEGASAFETALAASTPESQRISGERLSGLRGLIGEAKTFDPFAEYQRIPDYWLKRGNELREGILGDTRSADARRRIALGLTGPGQDSGYAMRAATADIQRNLQPFYERVFSGSGDIFSRLYGARQGERAAQLGLYDLLAAEPDRLAYRALLPAEAYSSTFRRNLGNLSDLAAEQLKNSVLYRKTSEGEKWLGTLDALENVAKTALAAYFGGAGGGMLGGIGGGAGGGAGGLGGIFGGNGGAAGGAATSGALPGGGGPGGIGGFFNRLTQPQGYGGAGAGGGFGGGAGSPFGGINPQQIMQLVQLFQRLYGGQPNIGSDIAQNIPPQYYNIPAAIGF